MFWAVDMVLDEHTMWTSEKDHVELYHYNIKQINRGDKHWYRYMTDEQAWRFRHELKHVIDAKGLTRWGWIKKYLKDYKFFEYVADQFANKHINASPLKLKELMMS